MTNITLRINGTAGRDAEIKYTQSGKPVASVTVAHTPRRLNEQTQQWEDAGETTWVRLNFWDKQAEAALHIKKGMRVIAEGTPRVSAYTGQGGEARASLDLRPPAGNTGPAGHHRPLGQPHHRARPLLRREPMDNTTETTVGELPDRALALILYHGYPVDLCTGSDARTYHPADMAARIVATLPPWPTDQAIWIEEAYSSGRAYHNAYAFRDDRDRYYIPSQDGQPSAYLDEDFTGDHIISWKPATITH